MVRTVSICIYWEEESCCEGDPPAQYVSDAAAGYGSAVCCANGLWEWHPRGAAAGICEILYNLGHGSQCPETPCEDDHTWRDSFNDGCEKYKTMEYCQDCEVTEFWPAGAENVHIVQDLKNCQISCGCCGEEEEDEGK